MGDEHASKGPARKQVGLRYLPSGPAVLSNHQVIHSDEHEVVIHFFQIDAPFVLGTDEEKEAKLAEIDHADAHPVAKVIICKSRFTEFAKAVAAQLTRISNHDDRSEHAD